MFFLLITLKKFFIFLKSSPQGTLGRQPRRRHNGKEDVGEWEVRTAELWANLSLKIIIVTENNK